MNSSAFFLEIPEITDGGFVVSVIESMCGIHQFPDFFNETSESREFGGLSHRDSGTGEDCKVAASRCLNKLIIYVDSRKMHFGPPPAALDRENRGTAPGSWR